MIVSWFHWINLHRNINKVCIVTPVEHQSMFIHLVYTKFVLKIPRHCYDHLYYLWFRKRETFPHFVASRHKASSSVRFCSFLQSASRSNAYFEWSRRVEISWLLTICPTYSNTKAPCGRSSKVRIPHSFLEFVQKICASKIELRPL